MIQQADIDSGKIDMKLMEKANPLLFSVGRLEEYPLEYAELKQYMTATDGNRAITPFYHQDGVAVTDRDYLDFLLYRSNDNDTEIDLDKKLTSEYALYQVQKQKKNGGLPKDLHLPMEQVLELKPKSDEWYQHMLSIMENINGIELDMALLKSMNPSTNSSSMGGVLSANHSSVALLNNMDTTISSDVNSKKVMKNRNNSVLDVMNPNESIMTIEDIQDKKQSEMLVQELTAYLISTSIKKGIDVKPPMVDDPVDFLKGAIDFITNEISQHQKVIKEARQNTIKRSKSYKSTKELETAFKDLQLAHSFLTRKFQNDREEYTKDIERLSATNRELQQKILNYHSSIIASENKVTALEKELKELRLDMINKPVNSSREDISPSSPVSASSNSITIMRNEFKKMLTETQKKHELELMAEKDSRLQLEAELARLRNDQ
ncbi:hypothetical protein TPHA_0D04340 [Tetrapisispora phaffii CBS 4417]|uniref:Uncharacterized protein n=1 Tax=Tetrapisispora phaffii (strain ATCC 24235 / CBS 4417 / NBRC 1672 / NRRL Y-8282 / UCD 70-5) TaxID=1071381 RepID=G8BRZ3_TETPH|nr:hypothetical protein TPHA_0D04340 [Tetrapisispora phaffii CBS 4417]CCE63068.1 hypothetical protein TPHA_0D04340 [Tetrapisispora phaffii CBS 4417]